MIMIIHNEDVVKIPIIARDTMAALWEFRGLTPNGGAGLVPAQCGATTRVARTPRNPEDPIFFLKAIAKLGIVVVKRNR
jgi:hypothetical protein